MFVELINEDVERSEKMKSLLIVSVKDILEFPYKGDSREFLLKILKLFESRNSNEQILDLIDLFLKDCEKKKPIKTYFFEKEFGFLEKFDFFQLYYDFLVQIGHKIVHKPKVLDKFFFTLQKLILKQKKPEKLNLSYFYKLWKFIYGNNFPLLKDRFCSFIIDNYLRFIRNFDIFPSLYSQKSLEELSALKSFYLESPLQQVSSKDLSSEMQNQIPLKDVSIAENQIKSTEIVIKNIQILGYDEQLLFKILFLIENSVTTEKKLKLLSNKLSDELFIVLQDLQSLKGITELWFIVKNISDVPDLQEFLIKLYRYYGYNNMLHYLKENSIAQNLTKLEEKGLTNEQKLMVRKYQLNQNQIKVKDVKALGNPLMEMVEKRNFNLCNRIINNLKAGIEYDNKIVIQNMLLFLRKFLFTFIGFLGEADKYSNQRVELANEM